MKTVAGLLVLMIGLAQYPLWFGKGSLLAILEMHKQINDLRETNQMLQDRNIILEAEVSNLKKGFDAIEELARSELSMIRKNELFFHIVTYESK